MSPEMKSRDSTLSVDTPHSIVASLVGLLLEDEHWYPILEDQYMIGPRFLIVPVRTYRELRYFRFLD